jgi:hypothetical protein
MGGARVTETAKDLEKIADRLRPRTLEELAAWCTEQMVEAQHGRSLEDAGRVSAYARMIVRIREMQRAR